MTANFSSGFTTPNLPVVIIGPVFREPFSFARNGAMLRNAAEPCSPESRQTTDGRPDFLSSFNLQRWGLPFRRQIVLEPTAIFQVLSGLHVRACSIRHLCFSSTLLMIVRQCIFLA